MASEGLTGSRIRERRLIKGMRQSDLARRIGISASYLNLIEHNRRRIGGKLLLDIANVLDVALPVLTQGAEAALVASLREAGEASNLAVEEARRAEEFAGRFPGWAETLASAHRRISTLERTVETLNDRMAHDPQLAASLYELLSTAAAIRSTAAILAETDDLDTQLQKRFHANMNQDSQRLSDSARTLVQFLDTDQSETIASPQEEVEAFMEQHQYSFPDIERQNVDPAKFLEHAAGGMSATAQDVARRLLDRVQSDGQAIAADDLRRAIEADGLDPVSLAGRFRVPLPLLFRRLVSLPEQGLGLVVCDSAGSIIFRKPIEGFSVPRFGAACPLWPVFHALSVPEQILAVRLRHLGRENAFFDSYSVAESVGQLQYNSPQLMHATMLLCPTEDHDVSTSFARVEPVGPTCRVCPRTQCPGRREPTILSGGSEL